MVSVGLQVPFADADLSLSVVVGLATFSYETFQIDMNKLYVWRQLTFFLKSSRKQAMTNDIEYNA